MNRALSRPRLWAAAALLAGALPLLAGCDKKQNAYVPPPPSRVDVARPVQQEVTPTLDATGNTVAYNQIDLVARVQGFLQEIDYRDGDVAKSGQTLFVIEPAPYQAKFQQAQATLAATQAQFTQADAEYNRQLTLGHTNVASQSAVDQARAARDADHANLLNQQAGVTLAGINLGYTHVTAPFDGLVTAHQASVGDLVGVTGPTKLASIVQLNPIYVTFSVNEQDVLRIRAALAQRGLTVAELGAIPVEIGLMNEQGYPHRGKIDYIEPAVDPSTGTLMVRGIFANADYALLPGLFVRVRVPLSAQRQNALLVPDAALGTDQAGRYLLVVNEQDVVEQRSVQVGAAEGALRVVTSGLGPQDRVVIGGIQRAIPGAKVAPQTASIPATTGASRKS